MLLGCFPAGGTDALYKTDGIMEKEHYVEMQKKRLKTSTRKSKLGHGTKLVRKYVKDDKVSVLERTS